MLHMKNEPVEKNRRTVDKWLHTTMYLSLTIVVLIGHVALAGSDSVTSSYLRQRPIWHGHTDRHPTSVKIRSSPSKAGVYYAGRLLGYTPLTLKANSDSTPYDIVLVRTGYMKLRTRIFRNKSRHYAFRLSPAAM